MFLTAWQDCVSNRPGRSWADCGDLLTHTALTIIEVYVLVAMIPLWVALPGAMFGMWMMGCMAVVYCLAWLLNGTMKEQVAQCSEGSDGWMMGQEADDERWMFVGGMGLRYEL